MNNVIKYIHTQAKSYSLIFLGIISANIGLHGFLLPNSFFDGGITGLSMFLSFLTKFNLSLYILFLNIPFILLGFKFISRFFVVKMIITIIAFSLIVSLFKISPITKDKFLASIFGGIFLGLGIGLSVKGGSVLDGTEVLALFINRKFNISIGTVIGIFNAILFIFIGILANLEKALYSIVTYFFASKTVDFFLTGFDEYIGVMIISKKWHEIRKDIIYKLKTGVTIIKSEPNFPLAEELSEERNILFCIVPRFELTTLVNNVVDIDEKAFIIQYPIKEVRGGFFKKNQKKKNKLWKSL